MRVRFQILSIVEGLKPEFNHLTYHTTQQQDLRFGSGLKRHAFWVLSGPSLMDCVVAKTQRLSRKSLRWAHCHLLWQLQFLIMVI